MPAFFRILTAADVRRAVSMPEAIGLMRAAFAELSAGRATAPVRTALTLPAHEGRALFMPAYQPSTERLALKAVTIFPGNAARGLPLIHALVLLFDATDGRPLALLDGEALTALRTGAAAGLATDLLARPDADVAALFGAGVQARTQLEAVAAVRPLRRVYVFSRTRAAAETFATEMRARHDLDVRVADDPARLREAAVVCTATTSVRPVFAPEHLAPGTHINGIGSYRPDMAEVPAETVAAARVVVDQREACLAEAGDLIQPLRRGLISEDHLAAELGEVAAGLRPGRTTPTEITFFKSVGNAVQDAAVAAHAAAVATRDGFGTVVALGDAR